LVTFIKKSGVKKVFDTCLAEFQLNFFSKRLIQNDKEIPINQGVKLKGTDILNEKKKFFFEKFNSKFEKSKI